MPKMEPFSGIAMKLVLLVCSDRRETSRDARLKIIVCIMIWGKLQRAHQIENGHFAPAYLGGSSKLRAYLFFIYSIDKHTLKIYIYNFMTKI